MFTQTVQILYIFLIRPWISYLFNLLAFCNSNLCKDESVQTTIKVWSRLGIECSKWAFSGFSAHKDVIYGRNEVQLIIVHRLVKWNNLASTSDHMWHDQGKLVAHQRFSIYRFLHNILATGKCYIWFNSVRIGVPVTELWAIYKCWKQYKTKQFELFLCQYLKNNICVTSDSFLLIMSHIFTIPLIAKLFVYTIIKHTISI